MENYIRNKNEENLEYIKNNIGYVLAKSLLLTIKTDTQAPLSMIRKHLHNFASFNEEKKKRKEILIKKLNSNNIKIHDEINKNFTKKTMKDLYHFVNNEDVMDINASNEMLCLMKNIFEVENVYIGTKYIKEGKNKKKKKKIFNYKNYIVKFFNTTENCELHNQILCNENDINNLFIILDNKKKKKKKKFVFEKCFMFNNFIRGSYTYNSFNDNFFSSVNPFYGDVDSLKRLKSNISARKKKIKGKEREIKKGDHDEEEKEDDDNDEEEKEDDDNDEEEKENGDDDDEEKENDDSVDEKENDDSVDEKENYDVDEKENYDVDEKENYDVEEKENYDGEKKESDGDIEKEEDINNDKNNNEKEIDNKKKYNKNDILMYPHKYNIKENTEKDLLKILNLNLTYACIYIYEVMEKENTFLYSYMKPGDFLSIPIIYYTHYNMNFLNELYFFKKNNILNNNMNVHNNNEDNKGIYGHKNDSAKNGSMQNDYNDEMIENKEDNKNEVFVLKNKKCIQPELKFIDENKVEMCLCFDNRGSTNKIKKKEIINIINFSYFLITRIFLYEKKAIENQVNFMIENEYGEEKHCIDNLNDKIKNIKYDNIINKYKNVLVDHYYFKESNELIKYVSLFLWIQKKISKNEKKIFQIKMIKVEYNRNILFTLFTTYLLLEYDYSYFTFLKSIDSYEWTQLIFHINKYFMEKLIMFNPIIYFEEKEISKLQHINNLIDKLSLVKNKKYPNHMENMTTYGITLLNFFNQVSLNILNEVIKIKENELSTT
ncbi:conserved Plasmodium protein, unknown function [Plasmodium sp. gorilla clade G3]|nr:conserved Plasmodium protein, unknown function [Plasmodium sp. gorilla clade G3]